jgi:N,N-dimethylformamidase beta subunit-like protein
LDRPQAGVRLCERAERNQGEPISLHISSRLASYDLEIYRQGWYGGAGARLVYRSTSLPRTNYGVPAPDPVTGRIEADWPVATTVLTNSTWTSGVYLATMLAAGGTDPISYIPFVVRNDGSTAPILYQVAFSTYQAYNGWGGKSLYDYNSPGGRAAEVSFSRPLRERRGRRPLLLG